MTTGWAKGISARGTESAVPRMSAPLRHGLMLVVLAALAFAPYWPSLFNGILGWDDPYYLTENYRVHQLTSATVRDMFRLTPQLGPMPNAQYTPLVELSFAIEHRFFGLEPMVYHATNLALHVANTLLVFVFVLGLWRSRSETDVAARPLAFLVGVFFAVHPLHVESVAWITERKDMLSGFFFLVALVTYLRFVRGRSGWAYGMSLAAMGLGVLSKQMVVSLPLVLLACDHFRMGRLTWRSLLEKTPFFALSAAGAGVAIYTHWAAKALAGGDGINWAENILVASRGVIHYLYTYVWPVSLSALYTLAPWPEILNAEFVLSVVAVAALVAAAFVYRQRVPAVFFGWMFFLLALIPSSRLVPVGIRYLAADRFFYIPGIGFLIVTAWLILKAWTVRATWRPALALGVAGLTASWSALTWERTKVWESNTSLWEDTAPKSQESAIVMAGLAARDVSLASYSNAVKNAFAALERNPNDAAAGGILSEVAFREGDMDKCIRLAAHVDRLAGADVFRIRPRWAAALSMLGRHDEAAELLESIVKVRPLAAPVYSRLALVHYWRGDLAAMEACLDQVIAKEPVAFQRYRMLWESPESLPPELKDLPAWQKKMAASVQTMGEHYEFIRVAHLELKRMEVARTEYERFLSYMPACVRVWQAANERRPGGREIPAILMALSRKLAVTYYNHACLLNQQNEPDLAMAELQAALAWDPSLIQDAMGDQDLASLRDRFSQLHPATFSEGLFHESEENRASPASIQPLRGKS